ncbi:NB-ARC domain-containing protein [Microcoleus sp. bin38.metabat.b11b12b14.051]|uniref:NB-ARC domain-containing protein n=1 Tax=Microcoleus sp. bin38.metabat.b11b12b14.051 TaxID=2742709 RepID=UPI0025F93B84|nr:NB-ARC domain-containing protein [Microcoleus sp. bin38.metabat.b11b12b14.051]
MDVKDVLQFTDSLFFSETGKHIDRLQETILKGTWDGQKYSDIAEEEHCTEGHVRNVASELWQILSNALDQEVNKSNLKRTLQRSNLSISSSTFTKDFINVTNVNFCNSNIKDSEVMNNRSPASPSNLEKTPTQPHLDLSDVPKIFTFYDRTSELTTLKQWILHENTRLLAILGIVGIGKTALAVHLVEQIKHEFDFIIWRSLATSPPLSILQTNIIQFLRRGDAPVSAPDEKATTGGLSLLDYLQKYRCLLILDDVQMVNSSGQLAGNYQPGYEDYGTLFRQVGELSHNSCLLLISSEKPREIAALEGKNQPVRSLQLNGLGAGAGEILREKGLAEDENWSELIELYRGNPLWLKIVATMIQDLFNGNISELLSDDSLFLGDLESLLDQPFNRLSEPEKQVMSSLASETAPVSIAKLRENMQLSRSRQRCVAVSQLLKIMQSLGRRSLIEKIQEGDRTFFTLGPVVQEYVKTQYSRPNCE